MLEFFSLVLTDVRPRSEELTLRAFLPPHDHEKKVIHTIAHLMNVINFSRRFDPFLGNLNMAEYKGQNPLQLLVSGKCLRARFFYPIY